jgi:hypothetical protein
MIVFSLTCYEKHAFDGWFRSSEDFHSQLDRGLVECPVCGDTNIVKQLSAPRINSGASATNKHEESASGTALQTQHASDTMTSEQMTAATAIPGLQQHMLRQFKQYVIANTENVGPAFAETARRMHYGEEYRRSIRGRVSPDDAIALQDEGIDTMPLPPGVMMDEGLQ